jgi:hypothetical protein
MIIPRCEHGNIILGCPVDDCPEQIAYLNDFRAKWDAVVEMQLNETKKMVRPWAADWSR